MSIEFSIDRDATKAAGFIDKRSQIRNDGTWLLKGKDMTAQREQLFKRDLLRCTWCHRAVTIDSGHLHHIVKRSVRRNDHIDNLVTLCAWCHGKEHGTA